MEIEYYKKYMHTCTLFLSQWGCWATEKFLHPTEENFGVIFEKLMKLQKQCAVLNFRMNM